MFSNAVSRVILRRCYGGTKITKIFLCGTPDFTKNTYRVSRGSYNYLNDHHVTYFESLLGEKRVIMDLSDLEKYNVDWYHQVRGLLDISLVPFGTMHVLYLYHHSKFTMLGSSTIVLRPRTTEEVSQILSFCDKNKLAVCPQGGNTSVVGGSVPVFDEIIVSMELMDEIISIDETSGILVCQSGCVLENLDNALEERGLMVPLDIGAKGTCHIGGNVSTNAGGMRLLRFGNMHGHVLGLEVVKANGEIIDCLSTLKKDNTGYHLKHLFIGSEGSLGVITKVALQCPSRPKCRSVAFLGVQNFENVLRIFGEAKRELGEILSAFEVMDTATMDFVKERNNQTSPIGEHPFYVLIETLGSSDIHDSEKLHNMFEKYLDQNLVSNGTVASEKHKIDAIWSIRENISNGYKTCGAVFFYDISLPLEKYYSLVEDVREKMKNSCERVFGYGHLGDGNIHLQIQLKEYDEDVKNRLESYVFEKVSQMKGSISAEHGLGFMKAKYLDLAKPKSTTQIMYDIKKLFDPKGILNPYKVFSK